MKNVLITGAGRGIGKAIAITLSQQCSSMLLISRTQGELQKVKDEIDAEYVKNFPCDLSMKEDQDELLTYLENQKIHYDTIIHCAGDGLPVKFDFLDFNEISRLNELHLISILRLIRFFLFEMKKNKYGKIIAISSLSPLRPQAFMLPYAATKSAMKSGLQCLADELIPYGININIVSPGSVTTKLGIEGREKLAKLHGSDNNNMRLRHLPNKKEISPEKIAGVVEALVSKNCDAISGQDIVVAGTLIMR